MPKKKTSISPWWLYIKAAEKQGFTRTIADQVWRQLDEEGKLPWKVLRNALRNGEPTEPPRIEGQTLRLLLQERQDERRNADLESLYKETLYKYQEDMTLEDILGAINDHSPHSLF